MAKMRSLSTTQPLPSGLRALSVGGSERRALGGVQRQAEHPVGVAPEDIFALGLVQVEPVDEVDVLHRADRHRPVVASEQHSVGPNTRNFSADSLSPLNLADLRCDGTLRTVDHVARDGGAFHEQKIELTTACASFAALCSSS